MLSFSRHPWTGLQGEIDRLLETALTDFAGVPPVRQFPVDLREDKDHTYVRAELPGVKREKDGQCRASRRLSHHHCRAKPRPPTAKMKSPFSFSRSVSVPEAVQTDKVAAAYENGVLTVTLPKAEAVKPRKIAVS